MELTMRRREFMAVAAALPLGGLPRWAWADDLPRDVKINFDIKV